MRQKQFEILNRFGQRFRQIGNEYDWCYGSISGTLADDKSIVKIFREATEAELDNESICKDIFMGSLCIKTYTDVIAVGYVNDATCLVMPTERRFTECPQCNFREEIKP